MAEMTSASPDPLSGSTIGVSPVRVGALSVHPVTLDQTLRFFQRMVDADSKATVLYANAHAVNLASQNPLFADCFDQANLVFCDGKAVQWASRLLGTPLPERFTPPDWIDQLCDLCASRSWRLFFLGGSPGVAESAAQVMRDRHEELSVRARHGYFQKTGRESQEIVSEINDFGPHVLLVGFGMPLQEFWLVENVPNLTANIAMSVGAMFDFVAGHKSRGPAWLTESGFEWLTRLATEPGRLGRRYLIGNPRFMWSVLVQVLRERRSPGASTHPER